MIERDTTVRDPRRELAERLGYSAHGFERAWRIYLYSHDVPRTERDVQDALPWFRKQLGLAASGTPGE